MAGQWRPGDSVPDRWLVALESGSASLEETCAALGAYEWPDPTPKLEVTSSGQVNPFPAGGWVMTVDAAYNDGRLSPEQYEALWNACSPRARRA